VRLLGESPDDRGQQINVLVVVVDVERGSHRPVVAQAQALEDGPGAEPAYAHRHPVLVQLRHDLVVLDAVHGEGDE